MAKLKTDPMVTTCVERKGITFLRSTWDEDHAFTVVTAPGRPSLALSRNGNQVVGSYNTGREPQLVYGKTEASVYRQVVKAAWN